MFIIAFAIFIFVFTVRESIFIGVITFIGICILLFIFQYFSKQQNKKIFFLITLAFLISLGSFLYKNNVTLTKSELGKSFIGTGIIKDTSTAGKYIFTTAKVSYLLQSKQEHKIGEEIFLVGRIASKNSSGSITDQSFLSFDYAKWLKMKGFQGLIYETNSSIIDTNRAGGLSKIKKSLQQQVIALYGKNRISGLILGMLIGDRSLIPANDYKSFISSGLVHLIAVSGGNLVMITVFLGMIFFFLPFYIRSGLILLVIVCYALLCGLDSSVFRAVITGGLSLLALFRGKEVPVWRLLSIAFVAMLIINPYYLVYDVGFLLSFGAVIGIIFLGNYFSQLSTTKKEKIQQGEKQKRNILHQKFFTKERLVQKPTFYIRKNYLQPSVGATMGVFPIIIFFMGQINLLSIVGNLFVLPIIPFVMIYGFISIFLFQVLHRHRLLALEKFLIVYIYKVSELSSSFGLYLSMSGWIKRVLLIVSIGRFMFQRFKKSKIGPDKKVGNGKLTLQNCRGGKR